jgi:hypothetical protein
MISTSRHENENLSPSKSRFRTRHLFHQFFLKDFFLYITLKGKSLQMIDIGLAQSKFPAISSFKKTLEPNKTGSQPERIYRIRHFKNSGNIAQQRRTGTHLCFQIASLRKVGSNSDEGISGKAVASVSFSRLSCFSFSRPCAPSRAHKRSENRTPGAIVIPDGELSATPLFSLSDAAS